jgi:hypothetical protein
VPDDLEAALDFNAAWPLIYPQGIVLYQEDDEPYEILEAETVVRGAFNGKHYLFHCHNSRAKYILKTSSTPSTVVIVPTAPSARLVIAMSKPAQTLYIPTLTLLAIKAN